MSVELLERERELASLDGLVEEAAAGDARLLLVEGAAGIGKTPAGGRGPAAGRGGGAARVLTARGGELEREFPFGVVRQLFEPLLGTPDRASAARRGRGGRRRGVLGARRRSDGGDSSFAALHGLYWLTVNLSAERRCCSRSTTCTGATGRRCASSPTSSAGSRACRCSWSRSLRPAEPGADAALLAELRQRPAQRCTCGRGR